MACFCRSNQWLRAMKRLHVKAFGRNNAHNKINKQEAFILNAQSLYGVLIDDLINKGTDEPLPNVHFKG